MKIIKLPFRVRKPILACGADLKGAFALAKGYKAYLFDGFGDLSDLDNFTRYERAIHAAEKKLDIRPKIIACDLHPDYFSTQFARKNRDRHHFSGKGAHRKIVSVPIFQVQHHEAHIASAIIDNCIKGEVLGAAFDGTGYGADGNIWGGEFFAGKIGSLKRVAHLEYIPMPGGEMCIKEPWRMAASYLWKNRKKNRDRHLFYHKLCSENRCLSLFLKKMIENKINSPLTSSMGRLFDAAGSIILNKRLASFEAELPIKLEKIADKNEKGYYDFDLKKGDGKIVINMAGTIRGILKDLDKNISRPKISAKFHNTIAHMILKAAKIFDLKKVVLSGGVFQNKFLVQRMRELLEDHGFKVYTHSNVETNDSGIPIGQIAIANERPSAFAINKQ